MNRAYRKLAIGGAVMALGIGYLGITGARSGWVYYLAVDDYAVDAAAHQQRSRVHGVVGEGAEALPAEMLARFELVGTDSSIPVEYRGAIPDMFAVGREVVVEGRMDDRGVFLADVLMTKCGSKYEPRSPGAGG